MAALPALLMATPSVPTTVQPVPSLPTPSPALLLAAPVPKAGKDLHAYC